MHLRRRRPAVRTQHRHSAPPGYVPDPYCVRGENGGAVGIHVVNFGLLIDDTKPNPAKPAVLSYAPLPGGPCVFITDVVYLKRECKVYAAGMR